MDKLTPARIKHLGQAVERIKSHDTTIEWIGKDIEINARNWGEKIRGIFGGNRLSQFTNEELGQIVAIAIINALLDQRELTVASLDGLVEAPKAPCPRQKSPTEMAAQ